MTKLIQTHHPQTAANVRHLHHQLPPVLAQMSDLVHPVGSDLLGGETGGPPIGLENELMLMMVHEELGVAVLNDEPESSQPFSWMNNDSITKLVE